MRDDFVSSDTEFWEARSDIASALPPDTEGTAYDSRAAAYDWGVGSALCTRLVWGVAPARHRAFARRAVATGRCST
jgi:hypothetical protein